MRRISAEHAHAHAALELLRVRNVHTADVLSGDRKSHHEVCLATQLHLPSRVLAIESAVVGAAAGSVCIPASVQLLSEHALAFCPYRAHCKWLIALDLESASQVSALLIRAQH